MLDTAIPQSITPAAPSPRTVEIDGAFFDTTRALEAADVDGDKNLSAKEMATFMIAPLPKNMRREFAKECRSTTQPQLEEYRTEIIDAATFYKNDTPEITYVVHDTPNEMRVVQGSTPQLNDIFVPNVPDLCEKLQTRSRR